MLIATRQGKNFRTIDTTGLRPHYLNNMWITVGLPIGIVGTEMNRVRFSTVSRPPLPRSSTFDQHRTDPFEQALDAFIPNLHRPYY